MCNYTKLLPCYLANNSDIVTELNLGLDESLEALFHRTETSPEQIASLISSLEYIQSQVPDYQATCFALRVQGHTYKEITSITGHGKHVIERSVAVCTALLH